MKKTTRWIILFIGIIFLYNTPNLTAIVEDDPEKLMVDETIQQTFDDQKPGSDNEIIIGSEELDDDDGLDIDESKKANNIVHDDQDPADDEEETFDPADNEEETSDKKSQDPQETGPHNTTTNTDQDNTTQETNNPNQPEVETEQTDTSNNITVSEPGAANSIEPDKDNEIDQNTTISYRQPFWVNKWGRQWEEGDEPDITRLSEIQLISKNNLKLHFGGKLKDDLFLYNYVNTLRTDFHDRDNFIRHKLNFDLFMTQGPQSYQKPTSEACVRLTNYVFWGDEAQYTPLAIDEIMIPEMENLTIAQDIPTIAKNVKVKSFIPLLFVEQAWFRLNFDTFTDTFKNRPTFLKVGYFPYIVGRGVAMGFHEDLAVDYLGWGGRGGYTRFPYMPPGALFRTTICNNLTWDIYFNLWRETNASFSDTLRPERWNRIYGPRPERGSGKNRVTWATRLDYTKENDDIGSMLLQPYMLYVDAPEQTIEFGADASSKLYTVGFMADWHNNNWSVNFEFAGQGGHQHMHAIDRNQAEWQHSNTDGAMYKTMSHIFTNLTTGGASIPDQEIINKQQRLISNVDTFEPLNMPSYISLTPTNKNLSRQGQILLTDSGTAARFNGRNVLVNSEVFGNRRFRPAYKLSYQGFMALLDVGYEFEKYPFKIAGALGYISGDKYPYNLECDHYYKGFVPMRSRYKGLGVQNFLIFDRLVLPRPLNISYRTLYAYDNIKDLGNLEYIGLNLTWFPYEDRKKLLCTIDLMFLWESATLKKWNKNGKACNPLIEEQLVRLRNTVKGVPTLFCGWESDQNARRMLGTEFDFKVLYRLLNHCDCNFKAIIFFPGGLYKDLDGQPNIMTRRVDEKGYLRYESLGHDIAFAFVVGLNYHF